MEAALLPCPALKRARSYSVGDFLDHLSVHCGIRIIGGIYEFRHDRHRLLTSPDWEEILANIPQSITNICDTPVIVGVHCKISLPIHYEAMLHYGYLNFSIIEGVQNLQHANTVGIYDLRAHGLDTGKYVLFELRTAHTIFVETFHMAGHRLIDEPSLNVVLVAVGFSDVENVGKFQSG